MEIVTFLSRMKEDVMFHGQLFKMFDNIFSVRACLCEFVENKCVLDILQAILAQCKSADVEPKNRIINIFFKKAKKKRF